MSNKINIVKTVRGLNSYSNVIDTEFTELVKPLETVVETELTVEDFFSLYERLFFDIPPEGEVNSHEYLVNRSKEYIGGSAIDPEKAALIEEINSLRQQLLDINETIFNVDKLSK